MNDRPPSNFDLFPDNRGNSGKKKGATETAPAPGERFEVHVGSSLKNDFQQRLKKTQSAAGSPVEATAMPEKPAVTGDNYQKAYLEERARQEAARAEQQKQDIAKQQNQAKEQEALNNRARARDLQNQIAWWKQQQGTYDDHTIDNNVFYLEQQLNGIPREFWY